MNSGQGDVSSRSVSPSHENVFDRYHWLYALCREHFFRDHTAEITCALFPSASPAAGTRVLEVGCGPGLYACRLAKEFPQIAASGIDMSGHLIRRARTRARNLKLENCKFVEGDARALAELANSVDAVIVSRLFLIISDKESVLSEIFRVLRPGGRCFIAEPTSVVKTSLLLGAMQFLAKLMANSGEGHREREQAEVMPRDKFLKFVASLPWGSVEVRHDNGYQYAICQKSGAQMGEHCWSAA